MRDESVQREGEFQGLARMACLTRMVDEIASHVTHTIYNAAFVILLVVLIWQSLTCGLAPLIHLVYRLS